MCIRDRNGKVKIRGNNIELDAAESITFNARSIRMEGADEISLQAPKVWSRGKKGNLVPKTWMQSVTAGSFIGKDKIGGFLEKGLVEAAGVFDSINDLQPDFAQLAGQAGALAQGLGGQLPAMQQQLEQLKPQIEGLAGELESLATSDAVTGLGESLQSSVGGIQSALQENSGAFANFGQGLQQITQPNGY